VRINRGETAFKATFANPGTAVTAKDFELNFTIGQARTLEPQEVMQAIEYLKEWLDSNRPVWQGI
jgi:hypothetical protein